ncbi:MAG: serine/threonine-protein kinase, partial [Myxococcota bacterium]
MAEPTHTTQMRIGRYHVEGKLGEGGMAETWLCRLHGAKGFTKQVVIKTLKAECRDRESLVMFADEARIGSKLEHPNIPRVLEFGEILEVPYLVQEYVEGPSLFHLFRRQKLVRLFDLRLGCRIVSDIARALHYAYHAVDDDGRTLHVVHRDVSPSNVLVSKRGPSKLIDFGVSTFEDRETHTRAGVLKGKLRYMAPEVLMRDEITHRSDLYSLGIVLYALCTGEQPWSGVDEVPDRLRGALVPPSTRRTEVDPTLEGIVLRCLELDPTRRFANGNELADALDEWLEANGGPMTDEAVAERVAALFPDGPKDWVSGFDLTALSAIGTRHQPRPATTNPWAFVLAGAVGLLAVSSVLLVAATGAAVYLWPRPAPPAP